MSDLIHLTDEMLAMVWTKREEFDDPLPHVNMVMGAYTTAQARLKLYSVLERLQRRVLYFDTDSVIFTQKDGECMGASDRRFRWGPQVRDGRRAHHRVRVRGSQKLRVPTREW